MDKVFVDLNKKNISIDLPKHGEVRLVVQDGKIIRVVTETSQKIR